MDVWEEYKIYRAAKLQPNLKLNEKYKFKENLHFNTDLDTDINLYTTA